MAQSPAEAAPLGTPVQPPPPDSGSLLKDAAEQKNGTLDPLTGEPHDQDGDLLDHVAALLQVQQEGTAREQPPRYLDIIAYRDLPDQKHKSLMLFSWHHPLRSCCRSIFTDTRFGNLVLVLILLNCILMFVQFAWPTCPDDENGEEQKHPCGMEGVAVWLDLFFTVAFTGEMFVKIVALGFSCHPRAYIRSAWNVLDFVIVLSSWTADPVPISAGSASQGKVLRLLRVLRPLRTMSRVAGLRTLMAALFGAMPEIRDNIVLLGFLILIFAILGVQLFAGSMHKRCLVYPNQTDPEHHDQWPRLLSSFHHSEPSHCGGTVSCAMLFEAHHHHDHHFASIDDIHCESDELLSANNTDDLVRDPLHFDNLGSGLLLVFKVFTGDDWPEDMNELQNSIGHGVFVYYFFCIMVGGLFATNLFLAVLISAYYNIANTVGSPTPLDVWNQVSTPPPPRRSSRAPRPSAGSHNPESAARSVTGRESAPDNVPGTVPCDPSNASDDCQDPSAQMPSQPAAVGPDQGSSCGDSVRCGSTADDGHVHERAVKASPVRDDGLPAGSGTPPPRDEPVGGSAPSSSPNGQQHVVNGPTTQDARKDDIRSSPQHGPNSGAHGAAVLSPQHMPARRSLSGPAAMSGESVCRENSFGSQPYSTTHRSRRRPTFASASIAPPSDDDDEKSHLRDVLAVPAGKERAQRASLTKHSSPPRVVWEQSRPRPQTAFDGFRHHVAQSVMHKATQNFIMAVTVYNVLVLASDHHNIDPDFEEFLNQSNLVCTIVFAVEIAIKTFGLGVRKTYLEWESGSGYNCFDLFLVLISVPDLAQGGSSSFTAFRAFRLMKLVRRFPSVHTQLKALVSSLSEGVYVSVLLLLLIFIFSILGMMFFEDKFTQHVWEFNTEINMMVDTYQRANFNTLWEAALTCFIIITGDTWGAVMRDGMIHTLAVAFLYFVVLFVLGNFVLVNVFVAVILEKLDAASSDQERGDVTLMITGAGNECNGIYHPDPSSEHEQMWKKDGDADGNGVRFLYSTGGQHPCWVVWHSVTREENDGFLTSAEHKGEMPHEVDNWRQNYTDMEWDPAILVDMCEGHVDCNAELAVPLADPASLEEAVGQPPADPSVEVPSGGCLATQAGVQLSPALRIEAVDPRGRAACQEVAADWVLVSVAGEQVLDKAQAEEVFAAQRGPTVTLVFRAPELVWQSEERSAAWYENILATKAVVLSGRSCLPGGIRARGSALVHSQLFELFILAVIGANVVFLALEYPGVSGGLRTALQVGDYVFTAIFFVEMVLKVAVLGVVEGAPQAEPSAPSNAGEGPAGPGGDAGRVTSAAYFSDPWNCLDCFVVVTAVIGLIPDAADMKAFRSLRTLRLVIRSQQLRVVIEALVKTILKLSAALAVSGFIFFVFAILGLSLFKGKFYHCVGGGLEEYRAARFSPEVLASAAVRTRPDYHAIQTQRECQQYAGDWQRSLNSADHFDNVWNSLLTLFVVAIGEGWAEIMYAGIDATSVGNAPSINNNPHMSLFFVIFFVVGNFFCLNMVIGVLIQQFTQQRRELDGSQGGDELDEKQRSYIHAEKAVLIPILFKPRPRAPGRQEDFFGVRLRCFRAVQHRSFDRLVTCFIIVNMLFFATVHHNQTSFWTTFQFWGNWVCSIFFVAEAIMKILGVSPIQYFRENWNRFDFVIVIVSVLDMFHVPGLSGISAVRVLRVGRLFRLAGKAKGLQKLFNTMFQGDNLYYFGNIGIFCIAIIFMFAVAGVNLFGEIPRSGGVDHNLNFENVGFAMITLFTTSTTEAWLDVRDGLVDGRGAAGLIFALVWIVVGSVVLLNLFAAVVVELFDMQEAQERCRKEIDAMEEFRSRWQDCFGPAHDAAEVDIKAFLDGLRDYDRVTESVTADSDEEPTVQRRGLLPVRLRRLPHPRRDMGGSGPLGREHVNLPQRPTQHQLLAYLAALGLPLRRVGQPDGGSRTVVRYRDVSFCFAARAFGLRVEDMAQIHKFGLSSGPMVRPEAFLASHWLAARMMQDKLFTLIERRKSRPSCAARQHEA